MSHPENTTGIASTQQLLTVETDFGETPIDNRGLQVFQVASGINIEDALETAKTLSSGLGQICDHIHDSLNYGEMAYTDGAKTLAFLAQTVSALVWSVQRAMKPKAEGEARQ
jgi:hypothetical protein